MSRCLFVATDEPTTHVCEVCGKSIISPHPPRKSYRRCTAATQPSESRRAKWHHDRLVDQLWQLAELAETGITVPMLSDRLTACESCDRFTGRQCDRYHGCEGRRRWLQRMAEPQWGCERWDELKRTGGGSSG